MLNSFTQENLFFCLNTSEKPGTVCGKDSANTNKSVKNVDKI